MSSPRDRIPRALHTHQKVTYLFWIVPVLAAGYLAWLIYDDVTGGARSIEIAFDTAPGIEKNETEVRCRGVQIGTVTGARLESGRKVIVTVELDERLDADFARETSQFWIVEPQLGLSGVSGLRALIGGTYIMAKPGEGAERRRFTGLSEPPPEQFEKPGREYVLLAAERGSIGEGAPVRFRDVQIGEVLGTRITDDARAVELHILVRPPFTPLVRTTSRFWRGGVTDVSFGLFGVEIDNLSLRALAEGGIALATPDDGAEIAPPLTVFRLYEEAQPEWLDWRPRIELGGGAAEGRGDGRSDEVPDAK